MAGPYTPKAKYGADVEEAMASATDPAMAIVGVDQATNTPTRRTPEVPAAGGGQGAQFSMGVDAPMYGWSLNQQDMGQGDVQQIRTDNFVTPVAEQRLPYGAAASRNDAVAKRRMQLEDAKAKAARDFDQFKYISDPAAQHQAAFSKYVTDTWWPETIQEAIDAFGFADRASAIDWMAIETEGQAYLKSKSRLVDAAAKQSFGKTERALDIMADIQANKAWLPPDQLNALSNYLNNYGETGVPNQGKSLEEFLGDGRKIDPVISLGEFQKQFVDGFKQYGEQLVKEGVVKRLPGGRFEITDEYLLDFEPYKEAMVQEAARAGAMGGDVDAIRNHFDGIIKQQVERKTRGWNAPRPKGGGGQGGSPKTWIGGVEKSISENIVGSDGPPNKIAFVPGETPGPTMYRKDTERRRVGDLVAGRQQPMGPRVFSDSEGRQITMKPQYIESDGMGNLYVSGELVGDGQTVTFTTTETDENGELKEVTKVVDTSKKSPPVVINLNDQRKTAESYFGPGWDQGFTMGVPVSSQSKNSSAQPVPQVVAAFGVTPERWSSLTEEQRAQVLDAAKKRKK
jgi:hypothetical protein